MTLHIFTAPSPSADPDAIDLGAPAAWLAPSADLLDALRIARYRASLIRSGDYPRHLRTQAWERFEQGYARELRERFAFDPRAAVECHALLARSRVVICDADAEVTYGLARDGGAVNARVVDVRRAPRRVVAWVLCGRGAVDGGEVA